MDKRVSFGLAALVLAAAGFVAGWLVRGQPTTPPPAPSEAGATGPAKQFQAGKEDEAAFWQYPKGDGAGFGQAGPQYLGAFTTSDDLPAVAAWYGERLGTRIPLGDAGAFGSGGGPEVFTAACDDSFRPSSGARAARPVRVGFGARTSPASTIAVTLSRADGEDRTHILVSFTRR